MGCRALFLVLELSQRGQCAWFGCSGGSGASGARVLVAERAYPVPGLYSIQSNTTLYTYKRASLINIWTRSVGRDASDLPRQSIRATGELAGTRGDELVACINDRVLIQIELQITTNAFNRSTLDARCGWPLRIHVRCWAGLREGAGRDTKRVEKLRASHLFGFAVSACPIFFP